LLVDNYLWQFYGIRITPVNHVVGKCLLEGLEYYKNIQMKPYDVTKETAEVKSDDVQ